MMTQDWWLIIYESYNEVKFSCIKAHAFGINIHGGKSGDKNDDKNDDKDGDMTFWQFYMAYTFDCLLINLLNSCLFVY